MAQAMVRAAALLGHAPGETGKGITDLGIGQGTTDQIQSGAEVPGGPAQGRRSQGRKQQAEAVAL